MSGTGGLVSIPAMPAWAVKSVRWLQLAGDRPSSAEARGRCQFGTRQGMQQARQLRRARSKLATDILRLEAVAPGLMLCSVQHVACAPLAGATGCWAKLRGTRLWR